LLLVDDQWPSLLAIRGTFDCNSSQQPASGQPRQWTTESVLGVMQRTIELALPSDRLSMHGRSLLAWTIHLFNRCSRCGQRPGDRWRPHSRLLLSWTTVSKTFAALMWAALPRIGSFPFVVLRSRQSEAGSLQLPLFLQHRLGHQGTLVPIQVSLALPQSHTRDKCQTSNSLVRLLACSARNRCLSGCADAGCTPDKCACQTARRTVDVLVDLAAD
jgi:hypothetical protein